MTTPPTDHPPSRAGHWSLTVERSFCAAHAITMAGSLEPLHGHTWEVRVEVAAPALDGDGLLCDFHALEAVVDEVLAPLRDRNLNEVPPFDRLNPTAEHVAWHLASAIDARVRERMAGDVRVTEVRVVEAPGCTAIFRPAGD